MGSLNMHFILTGIIIFITLVPPPVQGKKTYLIKTQKGDKQKHGKSFLISTVKKGERKGYSKKGRDYETGAKETQNLKVRALPLLYLNLLENSINISTKY